MKFLIGQIIYDSMMLCGFIYLVMHNHPYASIVPAAAILGTSFKELSKHV